MFKHGVVSWLGGRANGHVYLITLILLINIQPI